MSTLEAIGLDSSIELTIALACMGPLISAVLLLGLFHRIWQLDGMRCYPRLF